MNLTKFIKNQKEATLNLTDRQLLELNNELINRLIIEIHYLTNETLEISNLIKNSPLLKG